jgi:hypothetical protein
MRDVGSHTLKCQSLKSVLLTLTHLAKNKWHILGHFILYKQIL